jgi:hypothetical protein
MRRRIIGVILMKRMILISELYFTLLFFKPKINKYETLEFENGYDERNLFYMKQFQL